MARSSLGIDNVGSDWYLFRIGKFEHPVLIPLDHNEVVIGRISNKHLKKSPFISRKHACFVKSDDNWHVEDLGSTNGTYVNNVKINSNHPVRESDVVGLGMTTATSEDRFAFKLCKNSNLKGKCEVINTCTNESANALYTSNVKKANGKRLSSDASSSDTTIEIYTENCDSILEESQLSTLDHPQSLQHNNVVDEIHTRKLRKDTRLAKLELSNRNNLKLQNSSCNQHRDSDLSNEIGINNSTDNPSLEKKIHYTAKQQCNISNLQNFQNNENLHLKSMSATKEIESDMSSCATSNIKALTKKRCNKKRPLSDSLEVVSSNSKHHINAKSDETPQACKLQKTVHLSDCTTVEKNVGIHHNNAIENDTKDRRTTNEVSGSLSTDTVPELIEIEGPLRRRSLHCNQGIISRPTQNKPKLIDLSTMKECKTNLKTNKNKRDCNINVITVPDDGRSIIESIEIKEEVIILSDCEDDDCIVIDDESSKYVLLSNQHTSQFTIDEVQNNDVISQPSVSNHCNNTCVNSITSNFMEADESSNDTHFSETVDDCAEYEIGKPDFNIDENKLLSRISWPDLPAD